MQSQDDRSSGSSSSSNGGSAIGDAAAAATALPLPKHELLYHETKWLVLKLLSSSPSTAESPVALLSSSSRSLRIGRGNVSPRTLQTGVSLRLAGTIGNGTAMCYDLEVDGEAAEEPTLDTHDGPSSDGAQRRRQRASLTLDVRSAAAVCNGTTLEQSALQQVMEEEVSVELNRLSDELRDSHVDINSSPILTPQTEVANVLRALGDKMNEAFSSQLEVIAGDVVDMSQSCRSSSESSPLAYEMFERGARQLIGEGSGPVSTGWNSVALVLAYGQHVAWNLLKKGHKSLGDVADYTTRILWDHAAGFIVREGGWSAMSPLPSMASYLLDGSPGPTPATVDTVNSSRSFQTASAVRGTAINQVDGYIRLTRDQGCADCACLPKGPAVTDNAPATAGRGQGNSSSSSRSSFSPGIGAGNGTGTIV